MVTFVYCFDANTGKILWQDTLDHIDLMDEKTKAEARKVEAMQNDWAAMQKVLLIGGRLYYTFYVGQNGNRGRREADPMEPWEEGGVGPNGSDAQKAIDPTASAIRKRKGSRANEATATK